MESALPKWLFKPDKEGMLKWDSSKEIYPVTLRRKSEFLIYLQTLDIGSLTSQVVFLVTHAGRHLSVTLCADTDS